MKHKKITAALSAAVAGAVVLGGIRCATGKIKPKEGQEPDVQEDGKLAFVYCVSIGKDGGRLNYRFVDTYIKSPGDIPVCFDDLESGLNPELP